MRNKEHEGMDHIPTARSIKGDSVFWEFRAITMKICYRISSSGSTTAYIVHDHHSKHYEIILDGEFS